MNISNQNPTAPIEENQQEEIGLPKSTLWKFIKDVLTQNKVKADKSIYQLFDKISIRYVNYVSALGSKICLQKGKKNLNIEHILDALKEMNFNKHIKLLTSEPCLRELENEEQIEEKEIEKKYEDPKNVKQLINKKKKKSNKRKRHFETEEDLEEIAKEQKKMFEMARMEQMKNSAGLIMNREQNENGNNIVNSGIDCHNGSSGGNNININGKNNKVAHGEKKSNTKKEGNEMSKANNENYEKEMFKNEENSDEVDFD